LTGNRLSLRAYVQRRFRVTPRRLPVNLTVAIGPLVALIAGILILVVPRLLNYIVAIYLIIIGLLGLFGPQLAGLVVVRRRNLDEGRSFLLALLAVGLAGFVLFHQSGNSQVYFSHYGLVGGTLLAAEGLLALAAAFSARRALLAAVAMSIATATAVAFAVYGVAVHFSLPGPSLPALHARGALAVLLLAALFLLVWLWGLPERRSPLFAACFTGSTAIVLASWRWGWITYLPNDGLALIAALLGITGVALLLTRGRRRREFALAFPSS